MKLAVVGPTYPYRGGVAHFTTLLVRACRQRHQVVFHSYRRQYPRWLFPGSTAADPSAAGLREPCERLIDSLNPLTWRAIARQIVAERPDALLLQWWTPFWLPLSLVLTRAARRAGIPVLFLCHQLVEPDSGGYEWPIARLALRHADAFISLTSVERDILARAFPGRPVVGGFLPVFDQRAPQGIASSAARQLLGIAADVRVILFFGFVRRYKGLRTLLDALARLPDDVHLLIAGEFWEDEAEYRAQIARHGLTARVHIHAGYIPDEAVEPFFAASDVVALPYLSGSQSGVGMLAVNYAVPIVVSAVGGLGEMIEDGVDGIIVPPADPGALAAALGTTLEPAVNQRMRAALARLRQRRSWDALVDLIDATLTPSPTRKDAS